MSPEICNKTKYDGPATDIWASGIILYEMLFGIQPFKANSEPDLYKKITKGIYKMPKIVVETDTFNGYPEIKNAQTM